MLNILYIICICSKKYIKIWKKLKIWKKKYPNPQLIRIGYDELIMKII